MPYWENVTRSFRIAWRYKYLWLIALFAGEAAGGGGNFGYSQSYTSRPGGGGPSRQQLSDAQTTVTNWLGSHVGLVVLIVVVWLVLVIAFFVLAAICEGAIVRASAEHDADRPFHLGWAWQSGLNTMWVIIRFRLILFALDLPIIAAVIGLVASIIAAVLGNNVGAALIAVFGLLAVLAIPYAIYLYLLDRLGSRAVILEQLTARAGIVRGHKLLFKRFGRTLLVWLLSIAVALVVGLALSCVLGVILLPLVIVGVVIGATTSAAVIPLAIAGGLILFIISLLIQSFFSAQGATYWTLAFRRLDIDYSPAPSYGYGYQPPPAAPTPPAPPPQAPTSQ